MRHSQKRWRYNKSHCVWFDEKTERMLFELIEFKSRGKPVERVTATGVIREAVRCLWSQDIGSLVER